eukprot:g67678.t1
MKKLRAGAKSPKTLHPPRKLTARKQGEQLVPGFHTMEIDLDYASLNDHRQPNVLQKGFSILRAAAAMSLTAVAGFRMSKNVLNMTSDTTSTKSASFVPRNGVNEVLVRAGEGPGPLQVFPVGAHKDSGTEPLCIFSYGSIGRLQEESDIFLKGVSSEPGWVYGAKLDKGPLAHITARPGDVIKGDLLCWPKATLVEKLRASEALHGYDHKNGNQGVVRRGVASVVRKDGSCSSAYWYYQLEALTREKQESVYLTDSGNLICDTEAAAGGAPPLAGKKTQMLSFYKFVEVPDPPLFAQALRAAWVPLGALGRVYVAREGVNAQMAVPQPLLDSFRKVTWEVRLPGLDSTPLATVHLNLDNVLTPDEWTFEPPFRKLDIRARSQIVSDDLEDEHWSGLKWEDCGSAIDPATWHAELTALKKKQQAGKADGEVRAPAVVLDCRNKYETNVGKFEGSVPLNTDTFKETWEAVEKALKDVPKDAPVRMYCTGGIRCVKVGAYVKQKLGYKDVGSLQGGIVNYTSYLKQHPEAIFSAREKGLPTMEDVSLFRGVNFVFNDRMGERVTSDKPVDISDRRSAQAVAKVQCRELRDKKSKGTTPRLRINDGAQVLPGEMDSVEAYALMQSANEPPYLAQARFAAAAKMPEAAHMVSGPLQMGLMSMFVKTGGLDRILELGTFVGYATLGFATATGPNGRVVSIENDPNVFKMAQQHVANAPAAVAGKITLLHVSADDGLAALAARTDEAHSKFSELNAAALKAARRAVPFDLIYLDADKKAYSRYLDFILDHHLLRPGGLILADNTLWKGQLGKEPDLLMGVPPEYVDPDLIQAQLDSIPNEEARLAKKKELKQKRREYALMQAMHQFNVKVRKDKRLEQVVVNIRDGLTVIRLVMKPWLEDGSRSLKDCRVYFCETKNSSAYC